MKYTKLILGFVLMICLISISYADLTDGVVFYYSLDDANLSGNDPLDLSPNNNDGTNVGLATTGATGKINESFDFEESDSADYITIPNNVFTTPDAWSVGGWVNMESTATINVIFTLKNDYNVDLVHDSGAFQLQTYSGSAVNSVYTNSTTATWIHVMGTYDGTTQRLYINGIERDSDLASTPTSASVASRIGAHRTGATYFDGKIDEAVLYNRTLTPTEVLELHDLTQNPYVPVPETNVSFTANNVYDNSAINSFNITINGTTYNTTTGTITTAITSSSSADWNYNFSANSYYDQSGTINASVSLTEDVDSYQAIMNMVGLNAFFNNTVSSVTFNASSQNGTTLYTDSGSINVWAQKSGWYNSTQTFTVASLSNTTYYLQNMYTTIYNVTVEDWYNNVNLSAFNWTLSSGATSLDYISTGSYEAVNLPTANYNITYNTSDYNTRTYADTVFNTTDELNGKIYLTTPPRFTLSAYDWTGTTLLSLVTFTSDITGVNTNNPWNESALGLNESNTYIVHNISIVDGNGLHQNYNADFNFTRDNYTQNVTLSSNELALTFYQDDALYNAWGYISDNEQMYTFNGTSVVVVQNNMSLGYVNVRIAADNVSNHTQYYEYINDGTWNYSEDIEILTNADSSVYIEVLDPTGEPIEDVTVRAEFTYSELNNWTFANLMGQRLTADDGKTFFITDTASELILYVTKDGYTPKEVLITVLDSSFDIDNPLQVSLQKSSAGAVHGIYTAVQNFIEDPSEVTSIAGIVAAKGRTLVQITTGWRINNGDGLRTLTCDSFDMCLFTLVNGTDFDSSEDADIVVYYYIDGELLKTKTIEYTGAFPSVAFDGLSFPSFIIVMFILLVSLIFGFAFKENDMGVPAFMIASSLAGVFNPAFYWMGGLILIYVVSKVTVTFMGDGI